MRAYFDRTEPYYLAREPSFDGVEVEVSEEILNLLDNRKLTLEIIESFIEQAGAPEDSAQDLADTLVSLLEGELILPLQKIKDGFING